MRVALFCETYLPYLNGVVTHIKLLKEGLEGQGHQVMVIMADPEAKEHFLTPDHVLHCPSHRSDRLYGYGIAGPMSITRMRFLKEFDPDICHIHQEFGIGLFGVEVARRLDKPLVYTLHTMYDDYVYYVAPKPFGPMVTKMLYQYTRYLGKKADAITGPSLKVQEYFDKVGVPKKVHIVPNPVELALFSKEMISPEETKAIHALYHIPEHRFVAIFVGRLGQEKSVDVLLEYWKAGLCKEDEMHLLIVGNGPAHEELVVLSKELGLEKSVSFTGAVDHQMLLPYYGAAKVYITASLSDTYSISMLEGNALGLPTIQRYDPLNADQVVDGKNGFTFRNAEEMAKALRKVRDMSPGEYSEMQKAALAFAQKSSPDALATNILAVYHEAAAVHAAERKKEAETDQEKEGDPISADD